MTATVGPSRQEAALSVLRALSEVKGWFRDVSRWIYTPHSTAEVMLLALVERHGPARVSELAEHAHVDVSVISRQLAHLEQQGLLSRTTDPGDRRAHQVALSSAGAAALAEGRAQLERVVTERLGAWEPAELERLVGDLGRLLSDLRDRPQD